MRRVKRTAVIVIPKQPYIDWANSLEEGGIKLGEEDFTPEHTIYLVEDTTDFMIDKVEIIKPHFEFIFEEELVSWHRLVSDWPAKRDLDTFLEWFEVEIHSLVLDLHGGRLKTERY
jgi:hypothetical protein